MNAKKMLNIFFLMILIVKNDADVSFINKLKVRGFIRQNNLDKTSSSEAVTDSKTIFVCDKITSLAYRISSLKILKNNTYNCNEKTIGIQFEYLRTIKSLIITDYGYINPNGGCIYTKEKIFKKDECYLVKR